MRKILCRWSGHKEGVLGQGTNKQRPRESTMVKVVCRSVGRGSSGGHVTWVKTSGEGLNMPNLGVGLHFEVSRVS